jgi:hypothetical protein
MKPGRRLLIQGNALLVTLGTIAFVSVFVGLSMQYTSSITRNTRRSILLRQATNIGDASTEMAFSAWRAICRQSQTTVYQRSDFEKPDPDAG